MLDGWLARARAGTVATEDLVTAQLLGLARSVILTAVAARSSAELARGGAPLTQLARGGAPLTQDARVMLLGIVGAHSRRAREAGWDWETLIAWELTRGDEALAAPPRLM